MQGRNETYRRKLAPAVIAVAVHALTFLGFMTLGGKTPPPTPAEAVPIVWIPAPPRAAPPPYVPAVPAPLAAVPPAVPLPNMPTVQTAPRDDALSALGAYVACGLGQVLTADDRARCDKVLTELTARPGGSPAAGHIPALDQQFFRDKALQDQPLLRACYRRSGPDPLCCVRGYEVLVGSTAARDPLMKSLADPLHPR